MANPACSDTVKPDACAIVLSVDGALGFIVGRYLKVGSLGSVSCPITTDAIDSASSKVRRSMVFIDVMLDVMLALEGLSCS
jgi:hypothetical protein